MNMKKAYTTKELEALTGMSAKNLHGYITAGKINPDIRSATGPGTVVLLSANNLLQAMVLHECLKIGLPRRTIFLMFDSLNSNGDIKRLNLTEISAYNNNVLLRFLSNGRGGICHRFDLERNACVRCENAFSDEIRQLHGGIDLTDVEAILLVIQINLSRMARLLLKNLKK
ncbi:hypothetical protein LZ24_00176 [Desulfobotulus alkaliphilus]|uniref:Uncharacterized protein n=1 Tax=Desulfobotulus alkaliphilus TaxID=622671 RepID=A0A562S7J5_9BACT|nr:hypothetical protein [Desulfobotulus alkaliphilus]TWI77367.1 hypothetical protein LZ24_00176 [Desulfobotulus alkaliphilus]